MEGKKELDTTLTNQSQPTEKYLLSEKSGPNTATFNLFFGGVGLSLA